MVNNIQVGQNKDNLKEFFPDNYIISEFKQGCKNEVKSLFKNFNLPLEQVFFNNKTLRQELDEYIDQLYNYPEISNNLRNIRDLERFKEYIYQVFRLYLEKFVKLEDKDENYEILFSYIASSIDLMCLLASKENFLNDFKLLLDLLQKDLEERFFSEVSMFTILFNIKDLIRDSKSLRQFLNIIEVLSTRLSLNNAVDILRGDNDKKVLPLFGYQNLEISDVDEDYNEKCLQRLNLWQRIFQENPHSLDYISIFLDKLLKYDLPIDGFINGVGIIFIEKKFDTNELDKIFKTISSKIKDSRENYSEYLDRLFLLFNNDNFRENIKTFADFELLLNRLLYIIDILVKNNVVDTDILKSFIEFLGPQDFDGDLDRLLNFVSAFFENKILLNIEDIQDFLLELKKYIQQSEDIDLLLNTILEISKSLKSKDLSLNFSFLLQSKKLFSYILSNHKQNENLDLKFKLLSTQILYGVNSNEFLNEFKYFTQAEVSYLFEQSAVFLEKHIPLDFVSQYIDFLDQDKIDLSKPRPLIFKDSFVQKKWLEHCLKVIEENSNVLDKS